VQQRAGNTLESLLGYSLRVETSSIPNAGEGVKVKGKVPIGSLVVRLRTSHKYTHQVKVINESLYGLSSLQALFPGIVYVPEHFKKVPRPLLVSAFLLLFLSCHCADTNDWDGPWQPQYLQEISNNPYARARFDSVVIDAKRECAHLASTLFFSVLAVDSTLYLYLHFYVEPFSTASTPRNPLAVAHKINHPPAGSKPNVIPFSFDFPPERTSSFFEWASVTIVYREDTDQTQCHPRFLIEPFTQAEYEKLIPNSFVEMPSRWSMFGKRALVHVRVFQFELFICNLYSLSLTWRALSFSYCI
jgi:hypothetical protein